MGSAWVGARLCATDIHDIADERTYSDRYCTTPSAEATYRWLSRRPRHRLAAQLMVARITHRRRFNGNSWRDIRRRNGRHLEGTRGTAFPFKLLYGALVALIATSLSLRIALAQDEANVGNIP